MEIDLTTEGEEADEALARRLQRQYDHEGAIGGSHAPGRAPPLAATAKAGGSSSSSSSKAAPASSKAASKAKAKAAPGSSSGTGEGGAVKRKSVLDMMRDLNKAPRRET